MTTRPLSRTKQLAFSLVLLLVALGVLEVAARLLPAPDPPEPVVPPEVGRFSADLGWEPRPGSSAVSGRTGYPIDYRINALGLRDDETTLDKPDGVFRIVLLGDSRTFGYGVPIEKHFSKLLEGYFPRLEVLNLGVNGYGIDQQLLALRLKGFRFEPDLVLAYVAHYGNHRHMHTVRFGKQKPMFELEDGGRLVLVNHPVPTPGPGGGVRSGLRRSRLYGAVEDAARTLLAGGKAGANPERLENERNLQDPGFVERLYRKGEAILAQMERESGDHGAAFVLVSPMPELVRWARERGMPVLDVTEALDNDLFPLPGGLQHINEAGNGVLAWEIAGFLRREGLVPDPRRRANGPSPPVAE